MTIDRLSHLFLTSRCRILTDGNTRVGIAKPPQLIKVSVAQENIASVKRFIPDHMLEGLNNLKAAAVSKLII